MNETEALRKRRQFLLEQLSRAADEIEKIDRRVEFILKRKPGAGVV